MGNICCGEPIDYDGEVDLRHFELLRSVGKGAFGKVRIVQKRNDKKIYALKYINKMKCIKMKAVNNIIQERRLLEDIKFPFICNLRYAFQDDENMFMVIDLMLGGDLRFHLDRNGSMKEEVVRFYLAEVALGLQYLHSKRIVHRDLKPDNVLLDEYGHAHLTDFNIAVRYSENTPLKSVAGSMAYMAPEVVGKKGYFASPDWWSLGVMMYELLFGRRPFKGRNNEALTQSILHDTLHFPANHESLVSKECISILRGLIERDISKRLGATPENWQKFKEHPFFTREVNGYPPIDWDLLLTKTVTAPFVPDSKRANFDASHELEELLLEENPLRVKKRTGKRDFSKIPGGEHGEAAKEFDLIDKKFTNYNSERRNDAPVKITTSSSSLKKLSATLVKKEVDDDSEHSMLDLGNYEKEDGEQKDISKSGTDGDGSSEVTEVVSPRSESEKMHADAPIATNII